MNEKNELEKFIKEVFNELNRINLPYVVLRNYDQLPQEVGNDIDLLVPSTDLNKFSQILFEIANKNCWYLHKFENRYGFRKFIFSLNDSNTIIWDVLGPISWKGLKWVDSEFILDHRRLNNGFFIPSYGGEAAILVLKDILQHGKLKIKYLSRIQDFSLKDPNSFKKTLEKYFGKKTTQKILIMAQNGNWELLKKSYNSFKLSLIFRSLITSPLKTIYSCFKFVYMHLAEYVSLKNVFLITFIGPDGSGKSTLSEGIMADLGNDFQRIYYYHSRYGIFPELNKVVTGKKSDEVSKPVISPQSESFKLIKILLMFYYGLEHIFGYYILFTKRRKKTLFVFDRYYYDYVISANENYFNHMIFRLFSKIILKPDLIVYPVLSPETIFKRKPELSIEELSRLEKIYNDLSDDLDNSYKINNNEPLDVVVSKIKVKLLKDIANKLFNK